MHGAGGRQGAASRKYKKKEGATGFIVAGVMTQKEKGEREQHVMSVDGLGSCRGRAALIATGERSSTLHRREGIKKK